MRKLKRLLSYITRSWEDTGIRPHSKVRILPPILFDLLAFIIIAIILYLIAEKILSFFE